MELLLEHLGKGLMNIIMISMPIVLTAAGIGLVVGILQATTQVQEQTIAAAPKILGVFLVIIIGGNMIMKVLSNYMDGAFTLATQIIPKNNYFSAPPKDYTSPELETEEFFDDDKYHISKPKPNFKEMMNRPVDPPYLKKNEVKEPDISTPAQPLPNPSISEEIQDYKNKSKDDKKIRTLPNLEQNTPVIPPISDIPNVSGKISIVPNLDEPPAVISSETSQKTKDNDKITGASVSLPSFKKEKYNFKVKKSTIIIESLSNNKIGYVQSRNNPAMNKAIVLEAEL